MKAVLSDLAVNLRLGLRAMFLRRVALEDFRAVPDQLVALVVLIVLAQGVIDVAFNGLDGYFSAYALAIEMTVTMALLLAGFAAAKLMAEPRLLLAYPVALLSMDPFFLAVQSALRWHAAAGTDGVQARILYMALLAWFLVAAFVVLVRFAPGRIARCAAAFAVYVLLFFGCHAWLPSQDLWMARPAEPSRAARQLSVADEAMFHAQPALLEASLAALRPQRPGVADVYFVGVGAYSREDVFMKEVDVVTGLFRERFDAEGRTVSLINNPATAGSVPIATATNLSRVLHHLGRIMDPEEDVLVLYLTSHGSDKHRLAVVNTPLVLLEIDPVMLRRMLDGAGIKWRVIAVSACYAGGFIEPLKSDTTLIMTAADATKQSFGCGAESDFTYFGKALFDEALRGTLSFTEAFEQAREAIAERERAGKHDPSNPQIHAGPAMGGKWREVESRLRLLPANREPVEEDR